MKVDPDIKSILIIGLVSVASGGLALVARKGPTEARDFVEQNSPSASAIWAAFYCEGPNYRGDCASQQFSGGQCTQVLPAYSNRILSFLTSSSNCMLYQESDCTGSAVPIYSSVQDLRAFKKTNSYMCGLSSSLVATHQCLSGIGINDRSHTPSEQWFLVDKGLSLFLNCRQFAMLFTTGAILFSRHLSLTLLPAIIFRENAESI
ncbi:hypothetical protein AB1N83_007765 [Pleurotus pulmonarius]